MTLATMDWGISLDLVLSDLRLFEPMKEHLRGQKLQMGEELE